MRVHIQHDRNRVINRIGRLLETVNIKLGSVASNIVGKSGRAVLEMLAAGGTDSERMADKAIGQLRNKMPELSLALDGRTAAHFRWVLTQLLGSWTRSMPNWPNLDRKTEADTEPHRELIERLCTIPGIDKTTARVLIAELGTDMTQFPSAAHAASWAGLCPGNSESAGKRFSGKTRKGDRYLRRILRLLTLVYLLMRDGGVYRERGGDYFDLRNPARTAKKLTERLERIGFEVVVKRSPFSPVPPKDVVPAEVHGRCHKWRIAKCMHDNPRPKRTNRRRKPEESLT